MEKYSCKRRLKPTVPCQYGTNCYRKNPHHFMEYSHEHLNQILKENASNNSSEQYKIPDQLVAQKDLILEQIKVFNELFPNEPRDKKNKVEEIPTTSTSLNNLTRTPVDESCKSKAKEPSSTSTPHENPLINVDIHKYIKVVVPKGLMAQKLKAAEPYNYFLTSITSSPATHTDPLSITFQEILDHSLGELESSVQINFMVDIGWLLGQYYFAGYLSKPLLLLYGSGSSELETISQLKPQVTAHFVKMPTPFSTHHTKMMLLAYKGGSMRVVVSTANLYEDDWNNRTQGLWMSDKLDPLKEGSDTADGESPTEFRNELLKYLSSYKIPQIQPWLVRIRKTNFSMVNVFLVTSIPGTYHETSSGFPHGHLRASWVLAKHSAPIDDNVPIVAQSSSLGSFGANSDAWLTSEFCNSLRSDLQSSVGLRKIPKIRIIYPTFNNVVNGHDGLLSGGCLPYGNQIHQKQPWLNEFLYQWKADQRHRSKAMPHIKTYARWSDKKLYWFMLTSANISKAAWGQMSKAKTSRTLRISNYEAGVLFLPKFITPNSRYFSIHESDGTPAFLPFPITYDLPLIKYFVDDTPFLSDVLFS